MSIKKSCKYKDSIVYCDDLVAEYNFHSHNVPIYDKEIYKEVDNIIEHERQNKNSIIKIIVGKGNNSKFGPVIKPMVEYELLKLARGKKIKKFNLERMKNGKINGGVFVVEIY